MADLARFGVSVEKELLTKFDKHIKDKNYPTRSKAIGDLIRESLVKKEWIEGKEVVGAITLVYNHHRRELVNKLTDVEHDFHRLIISSQHIHLDEDNCLEIVVVKGKPREVDELAYSLKSTKGVKHGSLTMATTGKEIA
ncbi:nickel-responsive transcriptional regulator NikR [bacterium]|nr:nickel-responsive transcriptional regulator NikR [bacterium]NIN92053.1 nickel-responsive transcriptional regulator NikR [bacterium]NIO18266.1 nickel-responsive transcriptional regulator NikR [bacterium]NIO73240.1 nickel-responsive transcriptional regulator NikR [bacterium]